MKRIFKKRLSRDKKKEVVKEVEPHYTILSCHEESEEPEGGGCCFFPRKSSSRPSYRPLNMSPSLETFLPLKRMPSYNRLPHCTRKTVEKSRKSYHATTETEGTYWVSELASSSQMTDFQKMSLKYSPTGFDAFQFDQLNITSPKQPASTVFPSNINYSQDADQRVNLSVSKFKTSLFSQKKLFSLHSYPQSNTADSPERSKEEGLEEERQEERGSRVSLFRAESKPGETDPPIRSKHISGTNTLPPSSHLQFSSTASSCMTRSHSVPSLSKITKNNLTRATSLPDMKLKELTPDISADDFDDETYRFQCSCPGLYQCSVTGLVFVMKGEGDVVYRSVPWNRRLLAQHHKKPAGPLFDIKCLQQSVCQLHLPHCEIISTGGYQFLQVAHVNNEGIEFTRPHHITETHVVINITGFSGYGNVKDEDSPPDPIRALVLLFYKPPDDPDLTSFLNVLLLPRNIMIRGVQRTRRKLVGDERYIDTSPHCKLQPKQVYTLSTAPEDDLIKVQPKETDFDEEYHDNYFTSFQVILKRTIRDINLSLRDKSSSSCVWESEVCLLPNRVRTLTLPPNNRLLNVRSCFTEGISGPVLNSLLDKLLEKKVITDGEREVADEIQNRRDRARLVIDTVRKKGEAASSQMIQLLSELDSFFCEHLGLI